MYVKKKTNLLFHRFSLLLRKKSGFKTEEQNGESQSGWRRIKGSTMAAKGLQTTRWVTWAQVYGGENENFNWISPCTRNSLMATVVTQCHPMWRPMAIWKMKMAEVQVCHRRVRALSRKMKVHCRTIRAIGQPAMKAHPRHHHPGLSKPIKICEIEKLNFHFYILTNTDCPTPTTHRRVPTHQSKSPSLFHYRQSQA